ncbi:MAG TPA: Fe-S protein assembly co-chaperone HscB [Bacteroidia bacterium]|nr:Fe-S protein assembly co-chaperone HscB [Bacteroidia bacterium]
MTNVNYFKFFGMPVACFIDEQLLKEKYYQNTRQYHPDQFGQDDDATQNRMLELTTLNNAAYKTLKNFNSRVHYILDLNGLVTEGDKHTLDPAFLGEMMELNELLMELEFDPDAEKLEQARAQVNVLEAEINDNLNQLGQQYDSAGAGQKPEILQQVKEAYHRSKYILRLKETLAKFAPL